jgi:ABC-type molybdate transport system permease subunit
MGSSDELVAKLRGGSASNYDLSYSQACKRWTALRKKHPSTSALPPGKPFWRITLPNLKLSLIAAGLLIFTLSMDEIAVTFFLNGRDYTLPLEIWARLRRGITPEINAVSTLIFAVSVGLIVIWYHLRSRSLGAQAQAFIEQP